MSYTETTNPVVMPFKDINGVSFPYWEAIKPHHWTKFVEENIAEATERFELFKKDDSDVCFDNTFGFIEGVLGKLTNISQSFEMVSGATSDEDTLKASEFIEPRIASFFQSVLSDPLIYQRCQNAYDSRDSSWTDEQIYTAEKLLHGMQLTGCSLSNDARSELATIVEREAELSVSIGKDISDAGDVELLFTPEELVGVGNDFIKQNTNDEGRVAIRMLREQVDPVLETCSVRATREAVWEAFNNRGGSFDFAGIDTSDQIAELLALRQRRAELLGFSNFAELAFADTMAKTPENAAELINKVWSNVLPKASAILDDAAKFAQRDGIDPMTAWDSAYYLRQRRQSLDSSNHVEDKKITLKKAREAAFSLTEKIFGVHFELIDAPVHQPGAQAFLVYKGDVVIGGLITDFAARPGKRGGAWMNYLVTQQNTKDAVQKPLVANTCNFGPDGDEQLLTSLDVKTLFHELGHAMHGLLSNVSYPGNAGTNTLHDWVELPSQLLEAWVEDPRAAELFGSDKPPFNSSDDEAALEEQILFKNRYCQSAMVDLMLHSRVNVGDTDIEQTEKQILSEMNADSRIDPWHRLSHFSHLFTDGGQYAAGYYGYLWAEVLDADVYTLFKKDPFDAKSAKIVQRLYESGGSVPPDKLFLEAMGRDPDPAALLKRIGVNETALKTTTKVKP